MKETIKLIKDNRVAKIILNKPKSYNAFDLGISHRLWRCEFSRPLDPKKVTASPNFNFFTASP